EYSRLRGLGVKITTTCIDRDGASTTRTFKRDNILSARGISAKKAYGILESIRPDIAKCMKESEECSNSNSHLVNRDRTIDDDIENATQEVFTGEKNEMLRLFKKRMLQEWLQDMKDVYDSREYRKMLEEGVPLNSGMVTRLKSRRLGESASDALLNFQLQVRMDANGIDEQYRLRVLSAIRPDIYRVFEYSKDLSPRESARLVRCSGNTYARPIEDATKNTFNEVQNPFRRRLYIQKVNQWLSDIIDVADSKEYRNLYERFVPLSKNVYCMFKGKATKNKAQRSIKDHYLREKLPDGSTLHDAAIKILMQLRPDIHKILTDSEDHNLSKAMILSHCNPHRTINQDILDISKKYFTDDSNYFSSNLKRRVLQEWLQSMVESYDSPEYQRLLGMGIAFNPFTADCMNNKRLKSMIRYATSAPTGGNVAKLGLAKEAYEALKELRPDIHKEYVSNRRTTYITYGSAELTEGHRLRFGSKGELLVALLLQRYGLVDKLVNDKVKAGSNKVTGNFQVYIGKGRHRADFYVKSTNTVIEYHPTRMDLDSKLFSEEEQYDQEKAAERYERFRKRLIRNGRLKPMHPNVLVIRDDVCSAFSEMYQFIRKHKDVSWEDYCGEVEKCRRKVHKAKLREIHNKNIEWAVSQQEKDTLPVYVSEKGRGVETIIENESRYFMAPHLSSIVSKDCEIPLRPAHPVPEF
ncbi:hypothetical protein KY363_03330, partial [Candidatus Woesearchaeota archaeon]|nr:hypothetical protein [Candidatus Woesearchaeota archaeon]